MKKERVWKVSEGQTLSPLSCGGGSKTPKKGFRSPRVDGKNASQSTLVPSGHESRRMIPEPWRQSRRGQSSCADRN